MRPLDERFGDNALVDNLRESRSERRFRGYVLCNPMCRNFIRIPKPVSPLPQNSARTCIAYGPLLVLVNFACARQAAAITAENWL